MSIWLDLSVDRIILQLQPFIMKKKKKNGESLNINRVEIRVWSREPIKKGAHSHSHFYRKIKIRVLNQLIQLNHDKKRLLEAQYTPSNVLHISEPNH